MLCVLLEGGKKNEPSSFQLEGNLLLSTTWKSCSEESVQAQTLAEFTHVLTYSPLISSSNLMASLHIKRWVKTGSRKTSLTCSHFFPVYAHCISSCVRYILLCISPHSYQAGNIVLNLLMRQQSPSDWETCSSHIQVTGKAGYDPGISDVKALPSFTLLHILGSWKPAFI